MQKCIIGDIDIYIKDSFEEIPIYIAKKLHHLCKTEMPIELIEKYDMITKCETKEEAEEYLLDWHDKTKDNDFSNFYLDCISVLSDREIPYKIEKESLAYIYHSFIDLIVFGTLYQGLTYEADIITSFEHKGVKYVLPKEKKVFDLTIAMEGMTMIQFSEFSDLMGLITSQPNGFDFLSTAIAMLSLPEGELYDEENVKKVAKDFEDLPMSTVWDVFFYSDSLWNTFEDDLATYLVKAKAIKAHEVGAELIDWDGEGTYLTSPEIVEEFYKCPMLSN